MGGNEKNAQSPIFLKMAVLRGISDRIAVIHEGRIVEKGPTGRIITFPKHSRTEELIDSMSSLKKLGVNRMTHGGLIFTELS